MHYPILSFHQDQEAARASKRAANKKTAHVREDDTLSANLAASQDGINTSFAVRVGYPGLVMVFELYLCC